MKDYRGRQFQKLQAFRLNHVKAVAKKSRRAVKALLRKLGMVFVKRPTEVLATSPRLFWLRDFNGLPVLKMGRLVIFGLRIRFQKSQPRESREYSMGFGPYAVASFLARNLPDEILWASSRRTIPPPEHPIAVLGQDTRLLLDARLISPGNYFHFLLQVLPFYFSVEDRYSLILGEWTSMPLWQSSVASFFGIPINRLDSNIRIDGSIRRISGMYPSKSSVRALRHRLKSNLVDTCPAREQKETKPTLLIVDRQPMSVSHPERFLQNLDQLIDRLSESFTVRIVDFSSLPFRSQIEAINETDLIMGPHGAGLSNLVLRDRARPAGLIEISPSKNVRWHFEKLAIELGFPYARVLAPMNSQGVLGVSIVEAYAASVTTYKRLKRLEQSRRTPAKPNTT